VFKSAVLTYAAFEHWRDVGMHGSMDIMRGQTHCVPGLGVRFKPKTGKKYGF